MKSVHIRNIEIGAGMPKICVPITGKTNSEILTQVKEAVQHQPDLLEWRADFYVDLFDYNKVEALAEQMRVIMREIPLLFTVRTANEGGQCTIAPDKYRELLLKVSGVKEIDLFDVELLMDESMELLIQELNNREFDRSNLPLPVRYLLIVIHPQIPAKLSRWSIGKCYRTYK